MTFEKRAKLILKEIIFPSENDTLSTFTSGHLRNKRIISQALQDAWEHGHDSAVSLAKGTISLTKVRPEC